MRVIASFPRLLPFAVLAVSACSHLPMHSAPKPAPVRTSLQDIPEAKPVVATPKSSFGTTIATLGDVTRPGKWLKTPLVSTESKGRIVSQSNGKSASVDLIPLEGPKTAGSLISLEAMRALDLPLTSLAGIIVEP